MKKGFLFKTLPSVFLVIFLVFGVLINALFLLNKNKIANGIKIANIDLGGYTRARAKNALEIPVAKWLNRKVKLTLGDNITIASWKSFGLHFDLDKTISLAIQTTKQNGIFNNIYTQIKALFGFYNIPLQISWDQKTINDFTKIHYSDYTKNSQNAGLIYKNNSFVLTPSMSGRQPNWTSFKKEVEKRAKRLIPFEKYTLYLVREYPEIKDNEVNFAKEKARQILDSNSYSLVFEDKTWSLEKNLIASWIAFVPAYDNINSQNKILGLNIDKSLITNYLLNIVPEINKLPQNARLKTKNDNTIEIQTKAVVGTELLIEDSAQALKEGILEGRPVINLLTHDTLAQVRQESLDTLGIDSLIGRGESNFSGSSASRVNNITVSSSRFDEYLIKPNEEFSFNKILGEVNGKEGYLPGLVIKGKQLVPEYGGGICQVSTTMFRAAIYSGLKITERYPHSFPVSYYNPQGFDATVYPPHPDLRFINNTGEYVYIQRKIENGRLAFEMYGKKNDKTVKVKGPYVYSRNKEEDSFKTVLWQEIYDKDGNQLEKNGFWSHYQSPSLFPIATSTKKTEEN